MNWSDLLWTQGKFLGVEWHAWKVAGWMGNALFFSRFLVQWYATERLKRVVVPAAFWWLSLLGSGLLGSYALFYQKDSVFIFAYAFTWIPYLRNLIIHYRHAAEQKACPECRHPSPAAHRFCPECGHALPRPAGAPGTVDSGVEN